MMSNTATFTLHIRNIVKKTRDKIGWVLRVFQLRKRSLMLTLLKSLVIPLLEYCCQLSNPWKAKDIQAILAIQRTFTYKITDVQHKLLGKTAQTQIVLSPETPWTLYNYIYFEDNTVYGAKYWWDNGVQNKNQKTPKTCNTVRYSVSNKQKPSTIPSIQSNNCVWASVVQLVAKISETSKVLKLKNLNLSSTNFWSLFLMGQKCPTMSPHASGSNSILDQLTHLRAQGIYQSSGVPDSAMEQFSCFETTPSFQVSIKVSTAED